MKAHAYLVRIISTLPLAIATAHAAGPTQAQLNDAAHDSANWLYADHDYSGQRYTALNKITAQNAATLSPVCNYSFPNKEPSQTAPVVYDGVIYATTTHYTVAIDGATCKVRWLSEWKPKDHETFVTQRGAAIKDNRVVRGTGDGYLLALDSKTGKELWSRQIAKPSEGHFISMPPLIYDDLVLVGPAGSEFAAKGWIGAFRLSDGEPVWKFHTVPDPGEPGSETWSDSNTLKHGGGNIWLPTSFDVEKGLLHVPVGNPAPDFYENNRAGANLYTDSVVALDIRTGKLAWYYQAVQHDVRDYDLSHAGPVFTTTIGGEEHRVLALTGKDGLLRLLDRDTQKVYYSVPFTTRENAEGPLGTSFTHVCPGLLGGHEWNGAAYSPALGALFVPATDWCNRIQPAAQAPDPQSQEAKQGEYFGGKFKFDDWSAAKGWLTAFDAATGTTRWRYQSSKPMIGGVAVTGGGVVFAGELTGDFVVLDANDGKVLYKHNVGGPIAGGTVSYAAQGKQYAATVSGFVGGYYNMLAPDIGGGNTTITVFGLKK